LKILLINQTFYPDVVSTAQHLTDFAVDLAARGHFVTVLTCRRSYSDPSLLYAAREEFQGVRIVRINHFPFGKKNRFLRIFAAFLLNVQFAWLLLWFERHDKMIALTSPPLVGWTSAILARLKKSEFIYWLMDINPDQAILAGWLSKQSVYARLLGKALSFALQKSARVIVLDRYMKDRAVSRGADPAKIEVIPPWAHDDDFGTVSHVQNPFRKEHGLQEKFVVMYSGNHSVCHPLDTALDAALKLKDDPSVVFVFVGDGERTVDVADFTARNRLSNILQLPYQERENLRYSLSVADLHVVVMGNAFVGVVHPCKIYGILRVGRPFIYIGPEESHIGGLVRTEGVGFQIRHGNTEGFLSTVETVKSWSEENHRITEMREKEIAGKFSRKILSARLMNVITEMSK
jgi:hypothetical protein